MSVETKAGLQAMAMIVASLGLMFAAAWLLPKML